MAMDFPIPSFVGQLITQGGNQYVWDGIAWNIVAQPSLIAISDLPPANPAVGQQWWRGTNGQLYLWVDDGNSQQWVQAAGSRAAPTLRELVFSKSYAASAVADIVKDLSVYSTLYVHIEGIASAIFSVLMQTSTDNGLSFASTGYALQLSTISGTGAPSTTLPASAGISLGAFASSGGYGYDEVVSNFNKPIVGVGNLVGGYYDGSSITQVRSVSLDSGATAKNAFQFAQSAAGTFTGRITVEGVRG